MNDTTKNFTTISKRGLGHHNFRTTSVYIQTMDGAVASMYRKHEARLTGLIGKETLHTPSPEPVNGMAPPSLAEPAMEWPGEEEASGDEDYLSGDVSRPPCDRRTQFRYSLDYGSWPEGPFVTRH